MSVIASVRAFIQDYPGLSTLMIWWAWNIFRRIQKVMRSKHR